MGRGIRLGFCSILVDLRSPWKLQNANYYPKSRDWSPPKFASMTSPPKTFTWKPRFFNQQTSIQVLSVLSLCKKSWGVEGHLFGAPRQVAGCSDAGPLRLGMHLFVHNIAWRLERPKETQRHPLVNFSWLFFFCSCLSDFFWIVVVAVAVVVNRLMSESAEKVSPTCNTCD